MELNADLVPIKPLYFEAGSKSYDQAENTLICMARLLSSNSHISSIVDTIYLKLSMHAYCMELFHSKWSKF